MPRADKPAPVKFGAIDGKDIELTFDDLDHIPITDADRAIARLAMVPMPIIVDLADEKSLSAMLVAIDPKLKLSDVDEGLSKLEDLAIALLTISRECRHVVGGLMRADSGATSAAKILAAEADACLPTLEELGIVTDDEVETNARLLRSAGGRKS